MGVFLGSASGSVKALDVTLGELAWTAHEEGWVCGGLLWWMCKICQGYDFIRQGLNGDCLNLCLRRDLGLDLQGNSGPVLVSWPTRVC